MLLIRSAGHGKRQEDWEWEASLGFRVRPVGYRDPGKEGQPGKNIASVNALRQEHG